LTTPNRNQEASAQLFNNQNTAAYREGTGSADAYWTQGRIRFRVTGFTNVATNDADATLMPDSNDGWASMKTLATNNNVNDRLNVYFVRNTATGSNWYVPNGANPACWVKDTRNAGVVNTTNNFRMVAVSLAHEIGHYFGLPHAGGNSQLMTGTGTNQNSQLLTRAESDTAFTGAQTLAT
jgi:purine nucleoside permease